MFDLIAKKYDQFNTVASLGLCLLWNRQLIQTVSGKKKLLDLCSGTGKVAFSFLKKNPHSSALLLDLSPEMLKIAKERGRKFSERFETLTVSATETFLPSHCFDAITCAYGIRNISNLSQCFSEAFRLLENGGSFSILELTRPRHPILAGLHRLYLRKAIPLLGKWITKNEDPYHYLSDTILCFPSPKEIQEMLFIAGFQKIVITPCSYGIATIITARKY